MRSKGPICERSAFVIAHKAAHGHKARVDDMNGMLLCSRKGAGTKTAE